MRIKRITAVLEGKGGSWNIVGGWVNLKSCDPFICIQCFNNLKKKMIELYKNLLDENIDGLLD